jgi:hypothetical protein
VSVSEVLSRSAEALWHVLAVGLVLGVGLPALFALGIRFGHGHRVAATAPVRAATASTSSAGLVVAVLCFGLCVVAVVGGIIVIIWGRTLFAG